MAVKTITSTGAKTRLDAVLAEVEKSGIWVEIALKTRVGRFDGDALVGLDDTFAAARFIVQCQV